MNDILQEIIAAKHLTVENQKKNRSASWEQIISKVDHPCRSMRDALLRATPGIIAEFKRRSPSKGWIQQGVDPINVTVDYQTHGAAALSILTDLPYFGGTVEDLIAVRSLIDIPILRKEFVIDEFQLGESRAIGADAVLLIASALSPSRCRELAAEAHRLGLEVLLEIHCESELEYISEYVDMVGVNNRNLGTFHTTIENSFRLAEQLPKHIPWVSESGISDPSVVKQLCEVGFRGFLIGEHLMKTDDPGRTLGEFIAHVNQR